MIFDFFDGGAEDEITLKENVEAFKRITYLLFFPFSLKGGVKILQNIIWIKWFGRFRPRVLVDVTDINMSTIILGHRVSAPIMLAPSAMHQWAHPQG